MKIEIIKKEQVSHRSETRGVVITEVETHLITHDDGTKEVSEVKFWRDWETGRLVKIT